MTESTDTSLAPSTPEIGRNEPCPCGSGKKYKRCHGVSAAPKLSQPKADPNQQMPNMPPGMENMDPQMMMQTAQMLQRLPRGQLQRLQSIMQRAMAGKDVTREAEEFQKTLPPEMRQMLTSFGQMAAMSGAMGGGEPAATEPAPQMSEEEARAIVAKAAQQGKISQDQASNLLQNAPAHDVLSSSLPSPASDKGTGIGKFWKNLTGNKQS